MDIPNIGVNVVVGRHVVTGDLYISVTAVTNRRLDNRRERLPSALSPVAIIQDFQP